MSSWCTHATLASNSPVVRHTSHTGLITPTGAGVMPKCSLASYSPGLHSCKLKLPVTLGRYNNVDIEDRLCQLCARGDIGDETHYILKCPYFDNERCVYIKPYYMRGESNLKISELFNITDQEALKKLSRFIQCILTKFANWRVYSWQLLWVLPSIRSLNQLYCK